MQEQRKTFIKPLPHSKLTPIFVTNLCYFCDNFIV